MLKFLPCFFLLLFLVSACTSPVEEEPISYSFTEIYNAASCWLSSFTPPIKFGDWVGNGQYTELARELTNAPDFGKDPDGSSRGGYDYVKWQERLGNPVPSLSEVKNDVTQCDNLILTGSAYPSAGHTVVIFRMDLAKNLIYYVDQNFAGKGVTLRYKNITDIENSSYVIQANCVQPLTDDCSSAFSAPVTQTPPSVDGIVGSSTITSAEISIPSEDEPDLTDYISVSRWLIYLIINNEPEKIAPLIGSFGTRFMDPAIGAHPMGYNNSEYIIEVMRETIPRSEPLCLGFDYDSEDTEDRNLYVLFRGMDFDWLSLGLPSAMGVDYLERVVSFSFGQPRGTWELIYISPIDQSMMELYFLDSETFMPCRSIIP